jgi:hypothetical protein
VLDLGDKQRIKQVLVALSRMTLGLGKPFLLCFDQVDNLEDEQAQALARFLEALIDSSPNLLVVTAGVQATLMRWRQHLFQESAWHRLAQFEIGLQRLTPEQGRQIVSARLERSLTPFEAVEPVRHWLQQDHLFPLGQRWADSFFHDKIDLRPRDVVNGAREGWQLEQQKLAELGGPLWLEQWGSRTGTAAGTELTEHDSPAAIDDRIEQKLRELVRRRLSNPESLPPDADHLTGLVATLLAQAGLKVDSAPGQRQPSKVFPFNLIVRHTSNGAASLVQTGIRVLATSSAKSTAASLRWLLKAAPCPEHILLVTDARIPLALGGQVKSRARQHLKELRSHAELHFREIELSFEHYAHLDALQAVVGMARSGDLEIPTTGGKMRSVSVLEVIESHQRQGRYRKAPVLSELFLGAGSEHPLPAAL